MWIYDTAAGRRTSWLVLLAALAVAALVKWGGIRDPGVVDDLRLRWMLGWLPSFAAAVGFPYIYPALGTPLDRLRQRTPAALRSIGFLPECCIGAGLLIAGEIFDGLFPKIGDTALQTFAVSDIVATVAGAIMALALHGLCSRGR